MKPPPSLFAAVGRRICRLRQAKGLSRNELARKLKVDVSSIAGWETGKRLPRDAHRARLARALDCDLAVLLSSGDDHVAPLKAELVGTITDLPAVLIECVHNAKRILRSARLAAPYPTPAYVQQEWRAAISERLLAGTLEVQRVEIFYGLERLQETLSNILRYDGRAYHVKAYCVGIGEIVPTMGGYAFDDTDFFLGAYWTGVPPRNFACLRLSGPMISTFFMQFWDEIWPRGKVLNLRGAHDLTAVKAVALSLGLNPRHWNRFVEEARALEIGDGAPPLV